MLCILVITELCTNLNYILVCQNDRFSSNALHSCLIRFCFVVVSFLGLSTWVKQFFFYILYFFKYCNVQEDQLSGDVFGHVMCVVTEGLKCSALEYMEYLIATQNKLQFGILILYCTLKVINVLKRSVILATKMIVKVHTMF